VQRMMLSSTSTHLLWRGKAVILFSVCGMACATASCERRAYTKDFSVLSAATRIEVHDVGVRPLFIVTDAERIGAARDFIGQYEEGWRTPRWQGSAPSRRRFDFWDGDRYLGGFGINPSSVTTENYYQEAPAEEIARIAALLGVEWPPQE
jgi:hypothetical protein